MQLSTISLALTRLGGAFDPSSLFAGGTVAGAWYDPSDLSTMFDSSAGTTQCAMPGLGAPVPVGLMLDKSQGLVLGSELANAATQTLATATGTQSGAGWNITATGSFAILSQPSIIVANKWYKYTVSWSGNTNGRTIRFYAGGSGGSNSIFTFGTSASGTGTVIVSGGTQNTSAYFQINDSVNGDTFYLEITSVRELPGNHAIAFNDTTARPELSARVNLLTYSEEFGNADWLKYAVAVSANAGVAPDGTTTADLIYPSVTGTFRSVYRAFSGANSISVSAKASGKTWISMMDLAGSSAVAWFDVANGVIGTVTAGYTAAISSQGSGWYRCTLVANSGTFAFAQFNVVDANGSNTGTANGTDGVLLWGADGRPTNIGANVPAYQRIADANTYDTSGFPLYLRFDGVDDSMYTPANLNLSGTDKVSVFAGVRKLSDAGRGILYELGNGVSTAAFQSDAPTGAAGNNISFTSRGTLSASTSTAFVAPISAAFTSLGDIGNDICILRLNGAQAASSGSNQGTGNYSSNPLYICARGGTGSPFNGHLYSLVVAGSAVSAGNISATEQWVAGKTGIQI